VMTYVEGESLRQNSLDGAFSQPYFGRAD
jgi:hypothetical protein